MQGGNRGGKVGERAIDGDGVAIGIASDNGEAAFSGMAIGVGSQIRVVVRGADPHRPGRNELKELGMLIKSFAGRVEMRGRVVSDQGRLDAGRVVGRRTAPAGPDGVLVNGVEAVPNEIGGRIAWHLAEHVRKSRRFRYPKRLIWVGGGADGALVASRAAAVVVNTPEGQFGHDHGIRNDRIEKGSPVSRGLGCDKTDIAHTDSIQLDGELVQNAGHLGRSHIRTLDSAGVGFIHRRQQCELNAGSVPRVIEQRSHRLDELIFIGGAHGRTATHPCGWLTHEADDETADDPFLVEIAQGVPYPLKSGVGIDGVVVGPIEDVRVTVIVDGFPVHLLDH